MTEAPRPLLPTVELARELCPELPEGEPTSERRLAALVLTMFTCHRQKWQRKKRLLEEEVARLPTRAPPLGQAIPSVTWVVASAREDARLALSGSPTFVHATLEHVTDRVAPFREVFVPSALEAVSLDVTSRLFALVPPHLDDALECADLRPREQASAYRGARGTGELPTFHGHAFDDAIERAKAAIERVTRTSAVAHVRAFAWPVLHATYGGDGDALITLDGRGGLVALRPER